MVSMVSETRPRRQIAYINVAKAIAIFLVCYYHFSMTGDVDWSHSMPLDTTIRRLIYNIATACVPLFFMCTGALLINSPGFTHLKNLKRAGTTYLQFLPWATIMVLLIGWYQGVLDRIGWQQILSLFLGSRTIVVDDEPVVDTDHLWFIPAYIGVVLVVPFLRAVFFDKSMGWISYIGLAAITIIAIHVVNTATILFRMSDHLSAIDPNAQTFTPFSQLAGAMTVYAMIGPLAHRYRDVVIRTAPTWVFVVSLGIGMALGFLEWTTIARTGDPNYDYVFQSYTTLSGFITSVSVFLIILTLVRDVDSPNLAQRFCDMVAHHTLVIYYVHFILGSTLQMELRSHVTVPSNVFMNTTKAIVMILISIAVGEALRRFRFTRFLAR